MAADPPADPPVKLDKHAVRSFLDRVNQIYSDAMLTLLIDVGYKTGLLDAAAEGPATSDELADRAGLDERHVREWLGAMSTGGIFTYDPPSGRFTLPPEHAVCLTGPSAFNQAPRSQGVAYLGKLVPRVAQAFRDGGGVPYPEYQPDFTRLMDESNRRLYDERLIGGYIGRVDGVTDLLEAGIRVADVGCGSGHCVNLMAEAFPRSTFVGYDFSVESIERARAEASATGLGNAAFEQLDVTQLPAEPPFDLITAFDAIHDQVHPALVLRRIHDALTPDGLFLMIDVRAASDLEGNLDNPYATYMYAFSVMHCMEVGLNHGGAGLGTVWGEQLARRMLAEAGFGRVEVVPAPEPTNSIYVCRT